MIKGLKKDHNIISDLIFTQCEKIQKCLIDTFNIYIELFIKENCIKSLEVIYIKNLLKTIQISKLYYNESNDLYKLINNLQIKIFPILGKCDLVLKSISNNSKLTINHNESFQDYQIILNLYQEYNEIFTKFNSILSSFQCLLQNSKSTTEFNTPEMSISPTSTNPTTEIMIINFNEYDQHYNELIQDLYYLDELLKDLNEDIIKNSPCFNEFIGKTLKNNKHGDNFDEFKYEIFKEERIEKLGINKRFVFSEI
ncbi:hypothetical protein BN7_102 [Wickerhamomyces ciferrii]|uniref:Uncharacterized protein n=1 Tax=Wickerhamomyces ciferrii (strain ATCC 14091 / BCRC 22168 / CBS 111 / JCM 3599 / NBRC 0793 / NRRL Y-1031 F-60-10) TaxID=1206466 RepID=K0KGL2_WICCF|nr:uncharacterized protein BN7_102 [Wickerhamomyces ciferrii]CCH40569.1 hypothetical protein BN7_102 [Wickerhamomyces ciferrii]